MKPAILHFYYRGDVERGNGKGYSWQAGYSQNSEDGKPLYPWSTRAECLQEARLQNAQAVFHYSRATG